MNTASAAVGRPSNHGRDRWDYDFVIIGSGFGGSVAALRLAEKGYRVLVPFYDLARKMMGIAPNPRLAAGDLALKELARQLGRQDHFHPTEVGVYFGEPDVEAPDPYFNGEGPPRSGCNFCGGCMTGCRHNAKNSLDKNYLYLALRRGVRIQARSEVYNVVPLGKRDGSDGYEVTWRRSMTSSGKTTGKMGTVRTRGIVFAGGVLGTVDLLLKLKETSLPALSKRVGMDVRTNSESLIGIVTPDSKTDYSEGVAIGSILNTDAHTHLEPVRYSSGSGFWRTLMVPMAHGKNVLARLREILSDAVRHPRKILKILTVKNFAERTQILLFMQTLDSRLRFSRGRFGLSSRLQSGNLPTAFIPEARELASRYADIVHGNPTVLLTEILAGIPTTAHILGGAVMGKTAAEGVIDKDNRVFGYRNMVVCDGSMISANPGVNPSLTILALSERAMRKIPPKDVEQEENQADDTGRHSPS